MVWFLMRLLLIVSLLLLLKRLWVSLCGAVRNEGGKPRRSDIAAQSLVRDPECGLHLPLGDALAVHTERGMLYFCSRECRDAYRAKQQRIQA